MLFDFSPTIVRVDIEEEEKLRLHVNNLHAFFNATSDERTTALYNAFMDAVQFLSLNVHTSHSFDAYNDFEDHTVSEPKPLIHEIEIPSSSDYFDRLRELASAIEGMKEALRGLNSPVANEPEVAAVKAYLSSLSAFISPELEGQSRSVPSAIPWGLRQRLEKTNWTEFSSKASMWAETIQRLIRLIF